MTNGRWKAWVSSLKRNTYALYLAARDARVPIPAKLLIAAVVAYALSPIDLIPDFIPVVGYLDDMLLLPLGIRLVMRLIPREVWSECQATAARRARELPTSRTAAMIIIMIWVVAAGVLVLWAQQLVPAIPPT